MNKKVRIHFVVNQQPVALAFDPALRLLDVLREEMHLTGTKEGCGKGECGACTIIMDGKAVDSCLVMGYQADGAQITTIEGFCQGDTLHPLQQGFIDRGGVQCGICIPGMIVAAKALLDETPRPTLEEIKYGLAGNLCRCTGYVKIFEAVKQAATELLSSSSTGAAQKSAPAGPNDTHETTSQRPKSLDEAFKFFAEHSNTIRCVSGGTDILVQAKDGLCSPCNLFDISGIPELRGIEEQNDRIWIGAATPYDEIIKSPLIQTYAPALVAACAIIGGPQIRNRGTIGGNLGNASPAADTVPPLYSLAARVEIVSVNGKRILPIEEFFLGPRKTVLEAGELIKGVTFQKRENLRGAFLRLGQRQAQAISKVSVGLSAHVTDGKTFDYLRIALGAVAPTVVRAYKTEEILLNDGLNEKSLTRAKAVIKQEAHPIDDIRSNREYRREMCAVLLERALAIVT